MGLTWIIPTINQVAMVEDCLKSFFKFHDPVDHEVIVVDDGSAQDIQDELRELCFEYDVTLLCNSFNVGFSNSVNRGIDAASNEIVVLVNNDIIFTEAVASKFQDIFDEDSRIGIAGCLLFYPNGTIQHGGVVRYDSTFLHKGWHKSPVECPQVLEDCYIVGVTGALFAVRKKMTDSIGVMNPMYFIACEDTEMCLRAWSHGWRVYYSGSIRAIHAEGATRGNSDNAKVKKGREWMIKEKETNRKFSEDLKRFDFNLINREIEVANLSINRKKLRYTDVGSSGVIVVKRLGAIGDVLLTTGIVRKLKRKFPLYDVNVQTVCESVFRGNPFVSNVSREPFAKVDMMFDLDMAYERSPKMPVVEAYHRAVFGDDPLTDFTPEMFSNINDVASLNSKLPPNFFNGAVAVIHMTVSWPNRTWQRQKWLRVIDNIVSRGGKVAVVGASGDFKPDTKNDVLNLTDRLNIHEIRELVAKSDVFIGMDSGLLHVAMTTEVPVIGLFTCANPVYRMVERKAQSVALIPKVPCRFCLHDEKPPVTFVGCARGNYQCLNDITVNDVIESAGKFLFDSTKRNKSHVYK